MTHAEVSAILREAQRREKKSALFHERTTNFGAILGHEIIIKLDFIHVKRLILLYFAKMGPYFRLFQYTGLSVLSSLFFRVCVKEDTGEADEGMSSGNETPQSKRHT